MRKPGSRGTPATASRSDATAVGGWGTLLATAPGAGGTPRGGDTPTLYRTVREAMR
jgi:hypothetical protein